MARDGEVDCAIFFVVSDVFKKEQSTLLSHVGSAGLFDSLPLHGSSRGLRIRQ